MCCSLLSRQRLYYTEIFVDLAGLVFASLIESHLLNVPLYEFFQSKPDALIQLLQLNVQGSYVFESITLKRVERRIDGFFRRTDGEGPHLFLEVQGYGDKKVVWRLFQELTTYYLQSEDNQPFIAIVLYVDEKFDPKDFPFSVFRRIN